MLKTIVRATSDEANRTADEGPLGGRQAERRVRAPKSARRLREYLGCVCWEVVGIYQILVNNRHDPEGDEGADILEAVQENTKQKGINYEAAVSPAQGKLLNLLLLSIGAKRVLEVGSLGGYSAIWMARALPNDGEVVAQEARTVACTGKPLLSNSPSFLESESPILSAFQAIEENVKNAGLASKVKVVVGPSARIHNNKNYFVEAKAARAKGRNNFALNDIGSYDRWSTTSAEEGSSELADPTETDPRIEVASRACANSCTISRMIAEVEATDD
ncbi:O-methyltransferase-domain-containing protein [Mycena olivaceomarginata]|nr:O-methyltransferase-domain-containing protein [Mycena olivaceomarginata]